MTAERNPLAQRYLDQLGAALSREPVPEEERESIRREIDSHLAEAVDSGTPLTDALEGLGPAKELARAYAVELALNPRSRSEGSAGRLVAAATKASATLAAALLVVVMGSLGLGFALAGGVAVVAGIVAPFLPPSWLDPTLRFGLPQLVVIVLGLIVLAVGIVSLRIVRLNIHYLLRALRRAAKESSR